MNKTKGFIFLLGSAIIVSFYGIFVRVLSYELDNLQQIVFRNILGLIALSFYLTLSGKKIDKANLFWKNQSLLIYGLISFLTGIFFTIAVNSASINNAVVGFYTGSFFGSAIFDKFFLNRKTTFSKFLAVIASVASVILINSNGLKIYKINLGFAFSVFAGFLESTSFFLNKHLAAFKKEGLALTARTFSTILAVVLILILKQNFSLPALPKTWLVGIIFAICLIIVSYLTIIGFRNFEMKSGTVILSSEIILTNLFSFIFLKEKFTKEEIISSVLTFAAILLIKRNEIDKNRSN